MNELADVNVNVESEEEDGVKSKEEESMDEDGFALVFTYLTLIPPFSFLPH